EDHELGGNYVSENRAHKKPVFAFEQRHTDRAVMANAERMRRDLRLSTGGTAQPQRPAQNLLDLGKIHSHYLKLRRRITKTANKRCCSAIRHDFAAGCAARLRPGMFGAPCAAAAPRDVSSAMRYGFARGCLERHPRRLRPGMFGAPSATASPRDVWSAIRHGFAPDVWSAMRYGFAPG